MSAIGTSTSVLAAATIIQVAVAGASAQAADNVSPIGGDYAGGANVVAIPIDDPEVKAISGALFKPAGKGPFPAVIYMPQCLGLTSPEGKSHAEIGDGP